MATIDEQIECVRREIGMRQRVYPKRIEQGYMSQEQSAREINTMTEVLRTLQKAKDGQKWPSG